MEEQTADGLQIKDLAGLGVATKAVLEVFSRATGVLYGDWIHPVAKAREIKLLSTAIGETENNALIEQAKATAEATELLMKRTNTRVQIKEIRRQLNTERTLSLSPKYLEGAELPEQKVETDWATRFFDIVQDVSNEEVQELWAKILAGEILKPGSFSLRTLEAIRNLSREEAMLFTEKACPLVLNNQYIYKINDKSSLSDYNLPFGDILRLREAGLLLAGDSTVNTLTGANGQMFILRGKIVNNTAGTLSLVSEQDNHEIPVYILSSVGREIYEVTHDGTLNDKYMNDLDSFLKTRGFLSGEEYSAKQRERQQKEGDLKTQI